MHKIKHIYIVRILERMAEIMEEDKVTIKEEISTVEDTIKVVEEDVNVESTEHQGMGKWLNIISSIVMGYSHQLPYWLKCIT